jgi:hypothetical protein
MDACGRDASIGARAMGSAGLGRRRSNDGTKLPGLAVTIGTAPMTDSLTTTTTTTNGLGISAVQHKAPTQSV